MRWIRPERRSRVVVGRLQQRSWTAEDGSARSVVELPQAVRISPRIAKAERERSIAVPLLVSTALQNARGNDAFPRATATFHPGAVLPVDGRTCPRLSS
jgi:single-stranded DNA-binding protein